jgi:hypothetical protein
VAALAAVVLLAAVVILPGAGTAEDVADKPTGPRAATATTASMPRIALFRRDLVMSGDLSRWFDSRSHAEVVHQNE